MWKNESMWVSSHLVPTWKLRKTHHTDTLDKPCFFCQAFCLAPRSSSLCQHPGACGDGYIFRWDGMCLQRGETAVPAPGGNWASRGPLSPFIPTSCRDLLIGDLSFSKDIPESLNNSCTLDLLLLIFHYFSLPYFIPQPFLKFSVGTESWTPASFLSLSQ